MSVRDALQARWAAVGRRVSEAAARGGRDPASVRVIAVSKRQPAAAIEAAFDAGVTAVGENYVHELQSKRAAIGGACAGLAWHFIGALQRNKVKVLIGDAAGGSVALIHAVDSERLAVAIDARARVVGLVQDVLVAVSLAGEAQKSGVAPEALPGLLQALTELPALRCVGLMTMPPLPESAEDSRPHFRALASLRDRLATAERPLPELSMGTTDDFEVAVEEGATLVRVGTAVFGPRTVSAPDPAPSGDPI